MVVVFELRILRPVKEGTAGKLLRGFEPMVKGMRGLGRWAMVAWSSDRSEVVLQVVAERNIVRVDNAFASWRRVIAFGVDVKRGVWLAGYFADVRLGDDFEVACAEASVKVAGDAGALRCSSEEPALPEALMQAQR
jgi:hypothetical protein